MSVKINRVWDVSVVDVSGRVKVVQVVNSVLRPVAFQRIKNMFNGSVQVIAIN